MSKSFCCPLIRKRVYSFAHLPCRMWVTSISPPPWLLHPNRRCCSARSGWAGGRGGVLTFLSTSEQVLHLPAHLCVFERTPRCPGFMNREAGQRTEKSQYFVFRLLGRQGPAETQIRAHAPAQLQQSSVGGSWGSAQPVVTGALFPFPAGPSVSTTSDPHPRVSGDTGAGQSRLLWPTAP